MDVCGAIGKTLIAVQYVNYNGICLETTGYLESYYFEQLR